MSISIAISIVVYAIAANLDNLGVCIAYGANGTRVTPLANLIVASFSGVATVLSIAMGQLLANFFPGEGARIAGAMFMAIIGGWISLKALIDGWNSTGESREVCRFLIRPLGLVIQILKEPLQADRDQSKTIDLKESVLLGLALALNCLASGAALGMTNLPALPAAILVAIGSYGSTFLGWRIGKSARRRWSYRRAGFVAGLILVGLALFQLT